ncbi:hypothetical protein [Sphingopyxis macrogoltabida]|nr:hypothetical protein [Sphingopyxis macrogoltabida]
MGVFHMIVTDASARHRRVDFHADSPEQAFLLARNEKDGVEVELFEGEHLLARMTKSGANMWQIGGVRTARAPSRREAPAMPGAGAGSSSA